MSINIADQNKDDSIRLLVAQRYLYSKAKELFFGRLIVSGIFAIVAPLIQIFCPTGKTLLSSLSIIWLVVVYFYFKKSEAKFKAQGATVQEKFDTGLFRLQWNKIMVEHEVTAELSHSAERNFLGDREKLRNWYPDIEGIPSPLDILLCQRANLVWDWRLHFHYGKLICTAVAIFYIFITWLSIITQQMAAEYIFGLLLPSLPIILQGIETSTVHFKTADKKISMEGKISNIWDAGLQDLSFVTKENCRQIQDFIYRLRKEGPLVPDWWYNVLRDKYEIDMRSVIKELKGKIKERYPTT